jgi:hypothetical protein
MEKINPARRDPKWKPGFKIHITSSKETTTNEEKHIQANIKIYLDGSCI